MAEVREAPIGDDGVKGANWVEVVSRVSESNIEALRFIPTVAPCADTPVGTRDAVGRAWIGVLSISGRCE